MSPQELLEQARIARSRAYAPYSGYTVGAAVVDADGTVILGCNVENASYPATICAERVALTAALALGKRQLVALALVTRDGGSPCGICRQVMAELAPDMQIHIGDGEQHFRTTTVRALLPDAFGADSLIC